MRDFGAAERSRPRAAIDKLGQVPRRVLPDRVRLRLLLPSLVCAAAVLISIGGLGVACGPQAVGVDACRAIETHRCEAAAACGFTEAEVTSCRLHYADACLFGIENAAHTPEQSEIDACTAAVDAAGACAADDIATMKDCPKADVVSGAEAKKPCDVILKRVELLSACAFVAEEGGGGAGGTAGSGATGGGGSGGAGGAGGGGGTGGSGGAN